MCVGSTYCCGACSIHSSERPAVCAHLTDRYHGCLCGVWWLPRQLLVWLAKVKLSWHSSGACLLWVIRLEVGFPPVPRWLLDLCCRVDASCMQ
jgi:hypothetical protein